LKSFLYALFALHSVIASPLDNKTPETKCPNGWDQYRDSCYFADNPVMEFEKAQIECWRLQGTLLLAETIEEFEYVTEHSKRGTWSWIGITQDESFHDPMWVNSGGVNISTINWLVKPFAAIPNGWSSKAKCAAHLNNLIRSASYAFFFPCGVKLYSICEKNTTLLGLMRL
ncbi:lectin C-type domain protein, partial [Ancylostoma duodenale]